MKPDWLNDSSVANEPAPTKGNYQRRVEVPHVSRSYRGARTDLNAIAVSEPTNVSRIRQLVKPNSYYASKWGFPKSERLGAIDIGLEYPTWERSFRSSPSKGKPCTWRREAVGNLIQTTENV